MTEEELKIIRQQCYEQGWHDAMKSLEKSVYSMDASLRELRRANDKVRDTLEKAIECLK